jgi:hypothetical protein
VVAVDPSIYDSYVGSYKLADTVVARVTRDGTHLFLRLTGQQPVEFFPSSQTEFFAKLVNAQISFATDARGHATAFTLHQNGTNPIAPRMDEAAAQTIESALQVKVQSQAATPGTEAAVRRYFASLLASKPDYEDLGPDLAALVHQQEPQALALAQQIGAIQSMAFVGVQANGFDVYLVTHEHGVMRWLVALGPDGKVQGMGVTPGP